MELFNQPHYKHPQIYGIRNFLSYCIDGNCYCEKGREEEERATRVGIKPGTNYKSVVTVFLSGMVVKVVVPTFHIILCRNGNNNRVSDVPKQKLKKKVPKLGCIHNELFSTFILLKNQQCRRRYQKGCRHHNNHVHYHEYHMTIKNRCLVFLSALLFILPNYRYGKLDFLLLTFFWRPLQKLLLLLNCIHFVTSSDRPNQF